MQNAGNVPLCFFKVVSLLLFSIEFLTVSDVDVMVVLVLVLVACACFVGGLGWIGAEMYLNEFV